VGVRIGRPFFRSGFTTPLNATLVMVLTTGLNPDDQICQAGDQTGLHCLTGSHRTAGGYNLGSGLGRPLFGASRCRPVQHGCANSATIPEQVVGRDGTITVPYAGRIAIAGHTARDVQTVIEHALEGKAIQPQVLVNVPHSVSNTVTVTAKSPMAPGCL
jgi:protein involved in polysaccharide export with SLBB domain